MGELIMIPRIARIRSIREVTFDTLMFEVSIEKDGEETPFSYIPGQFAELSVFGVGESPISITSTCTRPGPVEFAVREVGLVTEAMHNMRPGDRMGIRGPLGNGFPVDEMKGKDILFIAGGIGLAPLRGLINYVLDNRTDFGAIDIVYGARTPDLLCFNWEFDTWKAAPDTRVHLTIDAPAPGWKSSVGFVPAIVKELALPFGNRLAVACGPPIMIKYVFEDLAAAGYRDEDVLTTLEMKMKCGVGKCGRCNIGAKYICTDGPVFRLSELRTIPSEY